MTTRQPPEPLRPAYAIWGEDRATVDRAVARLAARVQREGGMPPERLRAAETSGEDVVAICEALSFGGLRLVLVEGADEWKAADAAAVVAYLGAPNPQTCLTLIAAGAVTPKLGAAVAEAGSVLHYGPDPKDKPRDRAKWFANHVAREVDRAGGRVSAAVARRVVERVMVDRPDARRSGVVAMELSREAEKLAAYADGEPVGNEMVDALVPRHPDAKTYELSDALVRGDAAAAYDVLQDLATGDDPVAPIVVQVQLTNHFRRLARVQALPGRPSTEDAARVTGVGGFPARKLAEQAQSLPAGAAERAVARLAALELDLRVSALRELGRTRDDGERLVLESAARDLIALARGGTPAPEGR
ncbi:MAG: DNA polymerase III subunit delta [Thermoleophilia bacterium]